MREALRYPHLALVLGRQLAAIPLAEGRRTLAQIDGHVKHRALGHAHQLALRLLDLVMQAAQHALGRTRMVVLHEQLGDTGQFGKAARVVAFEEEAAVVAEDLGLEHQQARQRG